MKRKELTREQAHDLCVEMWNLIAEHGYTEKSKALCNFVSDIDYPQNACFACQYYDACNDCPFLIFGSCLSRTSPYAMWELDGSKNKSKAKKYAIEIADLFMD